MKGLSRSRQVTYRVRMASVASLLVMAAFLLGCGEGVTPPTKEDAAEGPETISGPGAPPDQEQAAVPPGMQPLGFAGTNVIARIDGEDVTQEDLELEIEHLIRRVFGDQISPDQRRQLQSRLAPSAFRQLVLRSQLRVYSDANGLEVEESEIDRQVNDILGRFGDEERAEAVLRQAGMTKEQIREDVARGALMEKAVNHYKSKIPKPSTPEVESFYQANLDRFTVKEHVVASHILIGATPGVPEASKAAKRAEAEQIREQLLAGADFAEMARTHSDCPSSRDGGRLDPFARGQMAPEFEKTAFELEPGTISDIVQTDFGFHIIQVSSHQPEVVKELDEIREDVLQQMERDAIAQWFDELINAARVEQL